ncbi:MAG TPA: TatD family hydrolase [Pelomicrobium sp.]|nr:TatD family hydrolase [Pelomicrobium sp.]
MQLVDSHCHLNFPDFAGKIGELRERMARNAVACALCISTRLETFEDVHSLAAENPNLYATVGVHPDERDALEPDVETLVAHAARPKVVAIGETGLDYYRLTGDLDWQRERFRCHIRAARAAGKPLVVHTRSAAADTLRLMAEEGAERVGGVMHCFTETWEVAERALELGFYISFSGIVTFKNAGDLREVARRVPLERILVETDAPYLAPVPHRGKINEPAFVVHVAEEVARLRDLSLEALATATTENFSRLFGVSVATADRVE